MKPLLALTVWQPWASLLAAGVKPVENRDWTPESYNLRAGDHLAIHASVKLDRESWEAAYQIAEQVGALPSLPWLASLPEVDTSGRFGKARLRHALETAAPYGAIVAVGVLDEVRREPRGDDPWWCGPVGWYLRDVVALPTPVPCKGAQGLWRVEGDVLDRVREGYRVARRAA